MSDNRIKRNKREHAYKKAILSKNAWFVQSINFLLR
jgi:hypothetical protein